MGSFSQTNQIDPYAVFEALTGQKLPREFPASSSAPSEDFEILDNRNRRDDDRDQIGREPREDQQPKDLRVGCINPFALVEAMIGRRLDRHSMSSARIISDVLQTDYDELFDLKHNSVLYAGLRLAENGRRVEEINEKEMRILNEKDLVTPDLSRLRRLEDLERVGLKDAKDARIRMARVQNGKIHLVVDGQQLARTASNRNVTETLKDLATPYRRDGQGDERRGQHTPPNSEWRRQQCDAFQMRRQQIMDEFGGLSMGGSVSFNMNVNTMNQCGRNGRFEGPVQGATSNSYLIAAIFSVFWSNPSAINRHTHCVDNRNGRSDKDNQDESSRRQRLQVRFHDKGGRNNNKTQTVSVDFEIPFNNSSNDPVYCRANNNIDIWPALYEKAFAKWITGTESDHPDITQTVHGDPIKTMAQINGREPHYFMCDNKSAQELCGLVRSCSVNYRTINPMCAYTRASGRVYRGANLVANHAYSVLGWTSRGNLQYIVLRNPFGITEPQGLTAYPGLVSYVEPEFWRPACMCDREGVLAVEEHAFREYFECIGVAK